MTCHLWIIRHAKSSWSDPGQADFDRGLNARGERDGERMAAELARRRHPPQWLLTSTARRARRTSEFVQQGFQIAADQVCPYDHLYHASADIVLAQLRETPPDCTSVALVAHNPGLTEFANRLAPEPWLPNLPTFGVAHFTVPGYPALSFGTGTLVELLTPKSLRDDQPG